MTHPAQGLTQNEATRILNTTGYNEIQIRESSHFLGILLSVIQEPMLILLISCGALYLALGEVHDGILLFFSVFIVISITVFQESKSEKALRALHKLSSPRALVIRDGEIKRIPGREVVPGDILALSEGDRIAADAILLSSAYLRTDESLLSGESFPVLKRPDTSVFAGTLIVGGNGIARVTATGLRTEMGRIGQHLTDATPTPTPLQRDISRLVTTFGAMGLGFSALITLAFGWTRGDWPHAILAGIAAAMSLLPEELSVVMTVFLAMGSHRISKHNVLTRKASATESLGAVTTLCVDKTGTLTLNEMRVAELKPGIAETTEELMRFGVLASHRNPYDPMEIAIRKTSKGIETAQDIEQGTWQLVHEYPLSNELLAMSCVWKTASHAFIIASKGAPEAIADLCHLSEEETRKVLAQVQEMGTRGLRVLGVAKATLSHQGALLQTPETPEPTLLESTLPSHPHDFHFEYLGLIGLEDPVRPGVADAVQECYRAGIRVLMMTGDYPATAISIAKQIGLSNTNNILTGDELRQINDLELAKRIQTTHIFARMIPDQKLRIVNALKNNGKIVAMTGDGVNDAPSLKWADIGIAMGARGTDVAREAADLVLLDDHFPSIVAAIRMGRRIFENIRKAMLYILSVHIPIAGMAILPVILKMPLLLFPAHIVFLELIIDPACSLVFEAEEAEADLMARPPRSAQQGLFRKSELVGAILQGLVILLLTFVSFWIGCTIFDEQRARTLSYGILVLGNLSLILIARSARGNWRSLFKKNTLFFGIVAGALGILALTIFVPVLQQTFQFTELNGSDSLWLLAATLLGVIVCKQIRNAWIA